MSKLFIPIKLEDFFDAEISIYSRMEFLIYVFEDILQRFSTEERVRRCSKIFTKQIKCRYLHKINEKSCAGIN